MLVIRWIIFGVVVLYFLLAFVFVHITVTFTRKIKQSEVKIDSLFSAHYSLLQLLSDKVQNTKPHDFDLFVDLTSEDKATTNRLLTENERKLRTFITQNNINLTQGQNYLAGLSENAVNMRNEIFRRNKFVENFNVNCDSIFFVVFIVIMRLEKLEKY